MVALLPCDPEKLVIDSDTAAPAESMHLTVQYLGDDVTDWGPTRRNQVIAMARELAQSVKGSFHARVMGHATFNPDGGPDGDRDPCAVYLIGDNPWLAPFQQDLSTACLDLLGSALPPQHTPFLPHIIAGYGNTAADLTYTGPIEFDRLVVALAGEWIEITFSSPHNISAIAREAYAQGWARSGGPFTERVVAGCAVAMDLVGEYSDVPGIYEATLRLGSLEGTWAAIYERREKLYAQHIAAVTAAYRALGRQLDVDAAVHRLQVTLPTTEADSQVDQDAIAAAAATAALGLLHHLADDPRSPEYTDLVSTIAGALMDAQAEGEAGAVALMAQETSAAAGVDFGLVFTDAHEALARLDTYWGDAQGWLGRIIDGHATDLGQALSRVAAAGGDFGELREVALDVINGEEITAVDTLIDLAMGQAFSRGAVTLYGREGVSTVDFVTVGGSRVCALCMRAESSNEWVLREAPHPALHPYCRCVLMPSIGSITSLSGNLTKYLVV